MHATSAIRVQAICSCYALCVLVECIGCRLAGDRQSQMVQVDTFACFMYLWRPSDWILDDSLLVFLCHTRRLLSRAYFSFEVIQLKLHINVFSSLLFWDGTYSFGLVFLCTVLGATQTTQFVDLGEQLRRHHSFITPGPTREKGNQKQVVRPNQAH